MSEARLQEVRRMPELGGGVRYAVRYDLGAGLGLRIEGTRREGAFGAAQHTVGVRGRLQSRWGFGATHLPPENQSHRAMDAPLGSA